MVHEQERFLNEECTITVKGFNPLNFNHSKNNREPTGLPAAKILLLHMIASSYFLHGIDHQHNPSAPVLLLKYPKNNHAEVLWQLPTLEEKINSLVVPEDIPKISIYQQEGLLLEPHSKN